MKPDPRCRLHSWKPKKWSRYRLAGKFAETTAQLLASKRARNVPGRVG